MWMVWRDAQMTDGKYAWCHATQSCKVAAQLLGHPAMMCQQVPRSQWTDRYSVCLGCGKWVNWEG